jgi:hypothetical protein
MPKKILPRTVRISIAGGNRLKITDKIMPPVGVAASVVRIWSFAGAYSGFMSVITMI